MSRIRSARKPAGKGVFLFALLLLLAWLCALPWILVDSDVPLTAPPLLLVDPAPPQ
ncbi:hypothetical protein LJR143_004242 [Pseudoxanthomonas sp. LjRoot143]|uniref:hypothetical protein n=1 Tax=Pseudoxanthomonas sp. LjRoot143 TaxID=3342266 RepID=UPI003ECC2B13